MYEQRQKWHQQQQIDHHCNHNNLEHINNNNLYCSYLKYNVSAVISSGLLKVSLVYMDIEMTKPGKSFLKFLIIKLCNRNLIEEISTKLIFLVKYAGPLLN